MTQQFVKDRPESHWVGSTVSTDESPTVFFDWRRGLLERGPSNDPDTDNDTEETPDGTPVPQV